MSLDYDTWEDDFIRSFPQIQRKAHKNSVNHGFWEGAQNQGEKIALMHAELSEALEGIREDSFDDHLPQRKKVEVELADCIIRIMDFAEAYRLDVAGALIEKMDYNKARPYKHGKAF